MGLQNYQFLLNNGDGKEVLASNLMDAFDQLSDYAKSNFVGYRVNNGLRVQVAGQANCGCVCHAEEGRACPHDLKLMGLIAEIT